MNLRQPRCLLPNETYSTPAVCGAPQWCGQCTCPLQPRGPAGWGSTCEKDEECLQPTTPGTGDLASVCVDNACQQCASDDDCWPGAPRCAKYMDWLGSLMARCVACIDGTHCGDDRPHCSPGLLSDLGDRGQCVQCTQDVHCAEGYCRHGSCRPGCTSDAECGARQICDQHSRCAPRPCASESDCLPQFGCNARSECERLRCASDADCSAPGMCFGGACYAERGRCIDTYVQMVP